MFQLKKSAVVSVLVRLAAALPGLPSHIAAGLQARGLPAGVPVCSTNDPSFSTATSQWANDDGRGYYAGSDCNNGGKGSQHCWFVISSQSRRIYHCSRLMVTAFLGRITSSSLP